LTNYSIMDVIVAKVVAGSINPKNPPTRREGKSFITVLF